MLLTYVQESDVRSIQLSLVQDSTLIEKSRRSHKPYKSHIPNNNTHMTVLGMTKLWHLNSFGSKPRWRSPIRVRRDMQYIKDPVFWNMFWSSGVKTTFEVLKSNTK